MIYAWELNVRAVVTCCRCCCCSLRCGNSCFEYDESIYNIFTVNSNEYVRTLSGFDDCVTKFKRANPHGLYQQKTDSRCAGRRLLAAAWGMIPARHAVGNEGGCRRLLMQLGGGFMRPNFPLSSRLKSKAKVKQMNLISLTKFAASLQS